MLGSDLDSLSNKNKRSRTKASFIWEIDNFPEKVKKTKLYSPPFRLKNTTWTLSMYPKYIPKTESNTTASKRKSYISVFICSHGPQNPFASWDLRLLNNLNLDNSIRGGKRNFKFGLLSTRGFHKFSSTAKILNKKNGFLTSKNSLKIQIRLGFYYSNKSIECSPFKQNFSSELSKTLYTQHKKAKFTDLTIFLLNNDANDSNNKNKKIKKYSVHRAVLIANSVYFEKMISFGGFEVKSSSVKLRGISDEIFEVILYFLYTGRCLDKLKEISKKTNKRKLNPLQTPQKNFEKEYFKLLLRLYVESNKFLIKSLITLCEKELSYLINRFTVFSIIHTYFFINLNELKKLNNIESDNYIWEAKDDHLLYTCVNFVISNLQTIKEEKHKDYINFVKNHPNLTEKIFSFEREQYSKFDGRIRMVNEYFFCF